MAVLRKLNGSGDATLATWDPSKVGTGDKETAAAIAEAERLIKEAKASGSMVVQGFPGTDKPAEKVEAFDPKTQEEVIILPRMAGGC